MPIGVVLAVALVVILLLLLSQAKRQPDATAFCERYQSINWTTADRKDEIVALKELERLAPDEIYPAVRNAREAWQKAEKNPTGAVAIESDVSGSTDKLRLWGERCKEEGNRVALCKYYKENPKPGDIEGSVTWISELERRAPSYVKGYLSSVRFGYGVLNDSVKGGNMKADTAQAEDKRLSDATNGIVRKHCDQASPAANMTAL